MVAVDEGVVPGGFGQRRRQGVGEPADHDARVVDLREPPGLLRPVGQIRVGLQRGQRAGPAQGHRLIGGGDADTGPELQRLTWLPQRRGDGAGVPRTAAATPAHRSMRPTRSSRRPGHVIPAAEGGPTGCLHAVEGRPYPVRDGPSRSARGPHPAAALAVPPRAVRVSCLLGDRASDPRQEEPRLELDPGEHRRGRLCPVVAPTFTLLSLPVPRAPRHMVPVMDPEPPCASADALSSGRQPGVTVVTCLSRPTTRARSRRRSGRRRSAATSTTSPAPAKPLDLHDANDPDWWIKRYAARENLDLGGALPGALALRREAATYPASSSMSPRRRTSARSSRTTTGGCCRSPPARCGEAATHARHDARRGRDGGDVAPSARGPERRARGSSGCGSRGRRR